MLGRPDLAPRIPPASASVQVWRDAQGEEAFCWAENARYWMSLPGLACFSVDPLGAVVTATPEPSANPDKVCDVYRRRVLPLALQALGAEVLHASAVLGPGGLVTLCGVSRSGKSTLAYALSRRGYVVAADDAVAFTRSQRGSVAISLPFSLRLRPSAAEFFGLSQAPSIGYEKALGDALVPLAAVFLLSRREGSGRGVTVRRLPPAPALVALLTHAYCFSLQDAGRKRQMITQYLGLVTKVPVFDVRFYPGLENLQAILDRLEATMRAA